LGGFPVAAHLASLSIGDVTPVFSLEQVVFAVTRHPQERTDSVPGQILARGSRMTYFVLRRGDTGTSVVSLPLGRQDLTDLATRGASVVTFINAIDDTSYVGLRLGCQTGDTLADGIGYARTTSIESTLLERSLFVVASGDSVPLATARLSTPVGTLTYLVATREGGVVKLYAILADGSTAGRLPEAPPEDRSTATVSVLNANEDGATISAAIDGGTTIASGLGPLAVSSKTVVAACLRPSGDRIVVTTPTGDTTSTSLRLTVGSDAMIAVFDRISSIRAIVLSRLFPAPSTGFVHVRCVNLSTVTGSASVAIGAGSPDTVTVESRPFGTLAVGRQSPYVKFKDGTYPFMLERSSNGGFLYGGVQLFSGGYYTLAIVDRAGEPRLMILRDDDPTPTLTDLSASGVRVTLLNAVPDADVSFTVGSLAVPPIAFSYVSRTVATLAVSSITSSVGSTSFDPTHGAHTAIAARASGSNQLFAFPVWNVDPVGGRAQVRAFSVVGEPVEVHDGTVTGALIASPQGTVPTTPVDLDARRYSFVVSRADGTIVAETQGISIVEGRRYLMVICPKREASTALLPYTVLWLQE